MYENESLTGSKSLSRVVIGYFSRFMTLRSTKSQRYYQFLCQYPCKIYTWPDGYDWGIGFAKLQYCQSGGIKKTETPEFHDGPAIAFYFHTPALALGGVVVLCYALDRHVICQIVAGQADRIRKWRL